MVYFVSNFIFINSSVLKQQWFNLKHSDRGIMFFAGSIRGAIAFGLAISIDSKNSRHKYYYNKSKGSTYKLNLSTRI